MVRKVRGVVKLSGRGPCGGAQTPATRTSASTRSSRSAGWAGAEVDYGGRISVLARQGPRVRWNASAWAFGRMPDSPLPFDPVWDVQGLRPGNGGVELCVGCEIEGDDLHGAVVLDGVDGVLKAVEVSALASRSVVHSLAQLDVLLAWVTPSQSPRSKTGPISARDMWRSCTTSTCGATAGDSTWRVPPPSETSVSHLFQGEAPRRSIETSLECLSEELTGRSRDCDPVDDSEREGSGIRRLGQGRREGGR